MSKLAALFSLLAAVVAPARAQAPVVITHVTLIDVEHGVRLPDRSVALAGNRITAVGSAEGLKAPAGAIVVDGRNKFLIPGLWDMHVHLSVPGGEALLSLFPIYGVTGVRDMNDSLPEIRDWQSRIAGGTLVGPRIQAAAGPYLVGGRPPLPHIEVRTPEQGRAGVDSLKAFGSDFVKVHNEIPREAYFAIAARVRELGWVYAGHVPRSVTVAEAADAGQRSLEHLTGFGTRCTATEAASLRPSPITTFLLGACGDRDLAPTIARLKANGTWITPTLTALSLLDGRTTTAVDSMSRYRSEGLRHLQGVVMQLPPMNEEAKATARVLLGKLRDVVRELSAAGVPLLVGTDAPTPGTFPGVSVFEELELLQLAGVDPAIVLRSATLEPARYFRATDSLGTIAEGKVADLVLLNADPLADIANVRKIAVVWVGGRMLDRSERNRLLTAAEAAAQR